MTKRETKLGDQNGSRSPLFFFLEIKGVFLTTMAVMRTIMSLSGFLFFFLFIFSLFDNKQHFSPVIHAYSQDGVLHYAQNLSQPTYTGSPLVCCFFNMLRRVDDALLVSLVNNCRCLCRPCRMQCTPKTLSVSGSGTTYLVHNGFRASLKPAFGQ